MLTCFTLAVFAKDLLSDPLVRGVTDVRHEIVAVASSSSAERAAKFIEEHGLPKTAKAYGSYEELVQGKLLWREGGKQQESYALDCLAELLTPESLC